MNAAVIIASIVGGFILGAISLTFVFSYVVQDAFSF